MNTGTKLLTEVLQLDPFPSLAVVVTSLIWFMGALQILNSVFIFAPTGEGLSLENTIQGSFYGSGGLISEPLENADKKNLLSSVQLASLVTVVFLGWLFGSMLIPSLVSNKFGRKKAFIGSCTLLLVASVAEMLSVSFTMLAVSRFFKGFSVGANGVISYVWGVEWMLFFCQPDLGSIRSRASDICEDSDSDLDHSLSFDKKNESDTASDIALRRSRQPTAESFYSTSDTFTRSQTRGSALFQLMWSFGGIVLSLLAFLVPYWRYLLFVVILVTIAVMVLVVSYVPESPKWLLEQIDSGNVECAEKFDNVLTLIKNYHSGSGWIYPLPKYSVRTHGSYNAEPRETTLRYLSFIQPFLPLFTPPLLLTTMILAFVWFSNAFIYYGISLNASHLPGNVYIVSALLNLVSIPGQLLLVPSTRTFGLKLTFVGSLLFVAFMFITMSVIRFLDGPNLIVLILSFMGEFGIVLSFSAVYLMTAQVYPTSIRATGVGLGVMFARVGAMLCPFVVVIDQLIFPPVSGSPEQGEELGPVAMIVLGLVGFISALLLLLLREIKI
jgi:MFS family permease